MTMTVLSIFSCQAQPHKSAINRNIDDNTTLWRVSGKDLKEPSYLFGTFHLLCKEDIHFSDEMKKDIKSAKEIYMEMDMSDPSIMLSFAQYLNMKNNRKLSDLYTPEVYKKISAFFKDSLHTPLNLLPSAKPYFLVAFLYPRMMNCKTSSGIEQELVILAKENKTAVHGLETMAFQASVFDSIPYEWQAKELLRNIDSSALYKRQFDTMLLAYKQQRMDDIERSISRSEFGSEAFRDILINNRNKDWVNKLMSVMQKESVFVAVGAGHLPGKDGLIDLLKKNGYTVEPLLNK